MINLLIIIVIVLPLLLSLGVTNHGKFIYRMIAIKFWSMLYNFLDNSMNRSLRLRRKCHVKLVRLKNDL